ncbi:MLO-like protein 11 [Hibiscus syriacus]|uniref:MLO-like protein 11 n=1 Tax=Hibiscus syriacus TaxID=106335 RepID=A0A6A3CQE5_HIBSY|nr:MLO-like protein 11 [Hibiscus syriacus]
MVESVEDAKEMRSVASTPTWSTATVLTVFVAVSLIVERSIHLLTNWLTIIERKPLLKALDKMKEVPYLYYHLFIVFWTCFFRVNAARIHVAPSSSNIEGNIEYLHSVKGHEPFVSHEGLEQLHRFIFLMAITHLAYSCLTMLLAIVKIHRSRAWEEEAHMDQHGLLTAQARESLMRRQTPFVVHHKASPLANKVVIWLICYFRQFGWSVVRADYLTLRKWFIMNHNLSPKYDFHDYMVQSMEEEFQMIVGIRQRSALGLVLLVGAKLQHIMSTLTLKSAGITSYCSGTTLRTRDELFWFKKPEWLLSLIHFILFQWKFGYNSCFLHNHTFVYCQFILGFAGQFMCSYITLPLNALVTQMGTNFKAALIPAGVRETISG